MFLLSSAVNTRFGDFSFNGRMRQTIDTVKSVVKRIPDAKIVIIESSGVPLDGATYEQLKDISHFIINFSGDPEIQRIHKEIDNWDIVKSSCEVACFNQTFGILDGYNAFDGIDRVHKLSGRYELTDYFNPYLYEVEKNKIILLHKKGTQFNEMVDIPYQYMSRLWSWPIKYQDHVRSFYKYAADELTKRHNDGRFADIEHLLYDFLDPKLILTVDKIGVKGVVAGRTDLLIDE
jgi:hypothetical protein